MESVWGGAQRVDLISILGVSDAGILGPQFATHPCVLSCQSWGGQCGALLLQWFLDTVNRHHPMGCIVLPLVVLRTG